MHFCDFKARSNMNAAREKNSIIEQKLQNRGL